jgi:hypothetical protein
MYPKIESLVSPLYRQSKREIVLLLAKKNQNSNAVDLKKNSSMRRTLQILTSQKGSAFQNGLPF